MIRWIVEGALGTAPYSDHLQESATVIDVRELVDKAGNDPNALRAKVTEGLKALESGSRVIVACDFGISRSNAVAAGVLALWKQKPFDWAIGEVISRTRESSIKLDVISAIRDACFSEHAVADPGRVWVTGGTGFLGRNVLARLSTKMETFAPARDEIDLIGSAAQLERFCRDRRIGQILHLAHPRVFTTNEALGESLTILKNLIDVCRAVGVRLVLPSGSVVFSGYRTAGLTLAPNAATRPKGAYGETKYLQELLANAAVRNEEIEATIVRIAPIYGPGGDRPRLIRYFYQALLENRTIVTHVYRESTPARLDLLYIEDAVAGIEKVMLDRQTPIHHLAAGFPVTPREIAQLIAQLLGATPEFTEMHIDDYASNVFLDSSISKKVLAWEPTVRIEDGLARVIGSYS